MSEDEARGAIRAPEVVIGYHGCAVEVAEAILQGVPLAASANRMDWLGFGVYFWEYAPYRALEWAQERFAHPAVLSAELALGECLNLLDRQHFDGLTGVYQATVESLLSRGLTIPQNTDRGAHFLDREVIDTYCDLARQVGPCFQSVRGCFPEGTPLYSGSKILSKAHVQIAIRDPDCIRSIRRVN